jgi:predicted SAM-dependent methyltransferase
MLEHLDRAELAQFFQEAHRVLSPNGIIRIAVPDIRLHTMRYMESGDADSFIAATWLTQTKPRTLGEKLVYLFAGNRHHHWMYDGASMCKLLSSLGFEDPRVMPAGSTSICNSGPLNLREREDESVYVEARNTIR